MKWMLMILLMCAGFVNAYTVVTTIIDAPDTGPITGLAWGNGSLLAVSAGSETVYRLQPYSGVISDSWPVSVPSGGYTITGLAFDGEFVYVGMNSATDGIIQRYTPTGIFELEEILPGLSDLSGLSCIWYSAGQGYIGTDEDVWTFDTPDVGTPEYQFDYLGTVNAPRDIGIGNGDNFWVANLYTGSIASLISPTGELLQSIPVDVPGGPIPDAYGVTVDSSGYLWLSSSDNHIYQLQTDYTALERQTWGAIKACF